MKIVITGINGLLGNALADELSSNHEVLGFDIDASVKHKTYEVDISNQKLTYDTISKVNPDIVIHTAAYSDVDGCEKNPDLAYSVNALGSKNIALGCQRFDTEFLYISTDFVFDFEKPELEGYKELDSVNPISVYAKSKYEGEYYTRNLLNKFYIVRTSWLFGATKRNFVDYIKEAIVDSKETKIAYDSASSPTYVIDLAKAIAHLITKKSYGIYHLSNSGFVSKYEVARYIGKVLGKKIDSIKKIKMQDLNLPARRPVFSGLDNHVWKLNGFKPLRPWQEAVLEYLNQTVD